MNRKLGLILLTLILCITQLPAVSASEIHHQPDLEHADVYSDRIIAPFYTLISSIHGTCYHQEREALHERHCQFRRTGDLC